MYSLKTLAVNFQHRVKGIILHFLFFLSKKNDYVILSQNKWFIVFCVIYTYKHKTYISYLCKAIDNNNLRWILHITKDTD